MNKEELNLIKGGAATVSASMVNTIIKAFTTIYDIGKALGSAISRGASRSRC